MKQNITILIAILFISISVSAQQTPYTSLFNESKAFWNPAATAYEDNLVINTLLRKQWVSFNGSPTTGYVDYQYPFLDYNMSVGGMINFDKTGPFTKVSVQANYAYKIQGIGGGDYSQLSLGISGGVQSYNFNADDEIYNDENDPLITDISGAITPTIGMGLFYTNNTRKWKGNSFYTGFAINQILQSDVLKGLSNQKRKRHIVANVGTKIYNYESYLEPSISINYVSPEIIDILVGVRYEVRDAFWGGIGYSSSKEVAIQGGVILDNINGKYARLKIGALANVAVTKKINEFGPGIELLLNYEFEMR